MCRVFAYAKRRLESSEGSKFYDAVLDVFHSAVLKTHRSKFVQFVAFVAASSSPQRGATLAKRLTQTFGDETAPRVTRVAAVASRVGTPPRGASW